jgi:phosphoglycerol transferase MdoB-like AlkP superfamily enzyme
LSLYLFGLAKKYQHPKFFTKCSNLLASIQLLTAMRRVFSHKDRKGAQRCRFAQRIYCSILTVLTCLSLITSNSNENSAIWLAIYGVFKAMHSFFFLCVTLCPFVAKILLLLICVNSMRRFQLCRTQ